MTKEEIKEVLNVHYNRICCTVLRQGANRAIELDLLLTRKVSEGQIRNAVAGLQTIYLYSLFEFHCGKITRHRLLSLPQGKIKNSLFIFKYYRDVFAHDYLGKLFPMADPNTIEFYIAKKRKHLFDKKIKIRRKNNSSYFINAHTMPERFRKSICIYIDNYM